MSKQEDLKGNIKKAAVKGDASALMGLLSDKDKEVFAALLKDKKAREELLHSPEARLLLEKFLGGK